jgi:sodium/proline symporter
MATASPTIALAFFLYLAAVLLLGFYASRRTRNLADFILAGRSLGPWVAALAAEASDMSGWLLLGLPGLAYAAGCQAVWLAAGLLLGTYANWKLVAAPLRRETRRGGDALTLPDYFAQRFGGDARGLRLAMASFILLFFTFYTAAGFVAAGRLFQTLFGGDYPGALALGGGVLLAYSLAGGFLAVSWAEMLQSGLVFVALLLVAGTALHLNGGFSGVGETLQAYNPALRSPWSRPDGSPLGFWGIASLLAWGLGYAGQPHILARFMAIRDAGDIPLAMRIAMAWLATVLMAAVLVGYTGIGVLERPLQGTDTEKVFIYLSLQLFPPAVAGVCLSAVLAAVMGAAAAQLLVAASACAEDVYQGVLRPGSGGRELLWVGRTAMLAIALAAYGIALDPHSTVLALVAQAWAGFGAAFGPVLLLSLYWPAMPRRSALAGMAVGGITVLLWDKLDSGVYALLPGFVLAALAALLAAIGIIPHPRQAKTPPQ